MKLIAPFVMSYTATLLPSFSAMPIEIAATPFPENMLGASTNI